MPNIFFIVGLLTVPGLIGLVIYNLYFRKAFAYHKFIYIVALILVPIAFLMTYKFNYYMNENTRIYGFPVLCAILQRDDANSPWLDYVGWITTASVFLNYTFYMFWPMLLLTVHRFSDSEKAQKTGSGASGIRKADLQLPAGFAWESWLEKFERMQERYVFQRQKRFETIADILVATNNDAGLIVDLGCGTGSLSAFLLQRLPNCRIVAVDYDPSLLLLAEKQFSSQADRIRIVCSDLRAGDWASNIQGEEVVAAVSSTSLHWFSGNELDSLYGRLFRLIRPQGIFLNSDHVSVGMKDLQKWYEDHINEELQKQVPSDSLSWEQFWNDYEMALGVDLKAMQAEITGEWNGIEEGLPLSWHFYALRKHGFSSVDCFWRACGEAVYGAIR